MFYRLYQLRNEKSLTKAKISKIIGISRHTYACYKNGERVFPTRVLIKLAKFYDVSTNYILGRTDEKKIK